MPGNPKVFMTYSHEENEHDEWVLKLASDLMRNGVEATLDVWDLTGGQDITFFMESKIRDSDYVVLICTPTYAEKSNISRGGVGYEKNIISAEMLQARGLDPKFIPVIRKGDYEDALPTYLGSKYAIDFRETRDYSEALNELLRAIYKQPHPSKPPLGKSPFLEEDVTQFSEALAFLTETKGFEQDIDIDVWASEVLGRFEYLRDNRISDVEQDPFKYGYWQASFVLLREIRELSLSEFLEILRASETHRSGWDIAWVPTRSGIAPYPFKDGIEVWLAENGGKGAGTSDFWRAEPTGRFSLFRGYQEDEAEFPVGSPGEVLDYGLVLWRISELLLYIESFSEKIGVSDSKAIVKLNWNGLKKRRIANHKADHIIQIRDHKSHQENVTSTYGIEECKSIKNTLIHAVHTITKPLFEAFDFFSTSEAEIKEIIRELFDADEETKG